MNTVLIEAPAKVNLRLLILARETSGYHSLETFFCGVSLSDRIEIARAGDGIRLEVLGGVPTGPAESNLAVRATRLFHRAAGIPAAVSIRLEKRIPSAAGLGGGSSDAAATLRALNRLHGDPLCREALLSLGAELGSDVPFFLTRTPFALGWGRGGRLLELEPPPSRPMLIADPGVLVPTPEVYARLAEVRGDAASAAPVSMDVRALREWPTLEALATNDLQPIARDRIPNFDAAVQLLRQGGATIALLSGSGSTLFGVFPSDEPMTAAAGGLEALGFVTHTARTLQEWPEPVLRAG